MYDIIYYTIAAASSQAVESESSIVISIHARVMFKFQVLKKRKIETVKSN